MNNAAHIEWDENTKLDWYKIVFSLKKNFGKKPDLNGILFLIGMREVGISNQVSKEEKMELMHVATCALLAQEGYYEYEHTDEDGWPHYKLIKSFPFADLMEQELYLRKLIVQYFRTQQLIDTL
jgi:hypothetical protein